MLPNDLAGVGDVGLIRSLNEDNWGWRKINEKRHSMWLQMEWVVTMR